MKTRSIIVIFAIAASMLACNVSVNTTEPAPGGNVPVATATNTEALPPPPAAAPTTTETPLPTDTATITPTPTSSVPMAIPIKDAVNCRFGPGTVYESEGSGLAPGVSAQILGKSADGGWWQIQNPSTPNERCWLAASVITESGDLATVAVVAPAPTFVTNVTVEIQPASINLGVGCPGPQPLFSLRGKIYVNGPATVKWHFETQKGGVQSTHTTTFTTFGYQDVKDEYSPPLGKGTYWVHLVITSPNSTFGEGSYQLKCS